MSCKLIVNLANGDSREFDFSDDELSGLDRHTAHEWLIEEFQAAGCLPSNPVGKLLLADTILVLAKTQPAKVFTEPSAWARTYLKAVAVALDSPVVTIDLPGHSLGY